MNILRSTVLISAWLCGLVLLLPGDGASGATLAESEVVRVRGGVLPDAWYEGRIGVRGTCAVILLDQRPPSGQAVVLLSKVGALERQDGSNWQEVPMKAQRASEPPECSDSSAE